MDKLASVRWLYHFTDSRTIPSIRELGGLWSTEKLREKGVTFYPGGNQHSLDADILFGMDKYVHLCFSMQHPLAYLSSKDGRIERLQWIYIEDVKEILEIEGTRYCQDVSNKSGADHHPLDYARENFDAEAMSYIDFRVGTTRRVNKRWRSAKSSFQITFL